MIRFKIANGEMGMAEITSKIGIDRSFLGAIYNFRTEKSQYIKSNTMLFIVFLLISILHYTVYSVVFLDDSYIYFRSVENFLTSGDLSFNPGDSRNLMTSPAWFLVLAASKFIFPDVEIILAARFLSLLFLTGSSIFLFHILKDRMPRVALFSPLPVFFAPSIPGLAGHETALALFSNLFLVWAFLDGRRILFPVAAVGAYLARGEAAVFASILGIAYICSDGNSIKKIITKALELAVGLAIALTIFILWHGYHYLLTGSVFADTFSAKILQADSGYWPLFALQSGKQLGNVTGPLWVLLQLFSLAVSLFGLWITWRYVWPLAVWPFVHYLTLTILGLPWYHWYYYPIEFAIILGFVVSGAFIASFLGQHFRAASGLLPRTAVILAVCLLMVGPLRKGLTDIPERLIDTSWMTATGRTAHVGSRFEVYRDLVDWIKRNHTKPTAPVILTPEIGILGYYVPDALLYDVVGLASPAESVTDMWNYEKYVGLYAPDFILRHHSEYLPDELEYQLPSGETRRYVNGITRFLTRQGFNVSIYRLDDSR